MNASLVRVGDVVYRRKKPVRSGHIKEIRRVCYGLYRDLLIAWDDGVREWCKASTLRLTPPGTKPGKKRKNVMSEAPGNRVFTCDAPGCRSTCTLPGSIIEEDLPTALVLRGWAHRTVSSNGKEKVQHLCPGHPNDWSVVPLADGEQVTQQGK